MKPLTVFVYKTVCVATTGSQPIYVCLRHVHSIHEQSMLHGHTTVWHIIQSCYIITPRLLLCGFKTVCTW